MALFSPDTLFTSSHTLAVIKAFSCALHHTYVCSPAAGTSMAARCVAASSVLPSPVTSTASMATDRTGRAAPSACVKVTELSY